MKVSYNWIQEYLNHQLPSVGEVARLLTMHAFEVEGFEKVGDDYVLDIDVLPNRTHDCLSHIGIAREVAVLTDNTLSLPAGVAKIDNKVMTSDHISLEVENTQLVRRAMKQLVVDVTVGESPEWLKQKLTTLGQRPINVIVDATNFVMLETGQPVHAFDYDKIAGSNVKEMFIRGAREKEEVTTLDGKTYVLDAGMLVIADEEKALDIAGVKGGNNSGIDENTTRVVLSACNFHPTHIRKTSRKLNLLTDASKRFEQEITPELAEQALSRLAALIQECTNCRVSKDVIDIYPRKRNPYKVGVTVEEVNSLLGTSLTDSEIETIFKKLGFDYERATPIEQVVTIAPTFVGVPYKYGASVSFDCPQVFDCGSLVNYLYVQAGVALPRMVQDQFVFTTRISAEEAQRGDVVFSSTNSDGKVEHIDTLDIDQVRQTKRSLEFLPGAALEKSVDHAGIYMGEGKVLHASPMWDKGEVVIEDIAASKAFVTVVGYGRVVEAYGERYVVTPPSERLDLMSARGFLVSGISADLIEEIGRVYGYGNISPEIPKVAVGPEVNKLFYYSHKVRDILVGLGFSEVFTYSFQSSGDVEVANPIASDKSFLRSSLEHELLHARVVNKTNAPLLGVFDGKIKIFEIGTVFGEKEEYVELGIAISGKKVEQEIKDVWQKIAGELNSSEHIGAPSYGGISRINFTRVVEKLSEPASYDDIKEVDTSGIIYKPFSPYPFVLRDIAVWVPDGDAETLLGVIQEHAGPLLVQHTLFDEYAKDGRTSYAYHLVFQSDEKTLSDDEVNTIMERVTTTIESKGWEVR